VIQYECHCELGTINSRSPTITYNESADTEDQIITAQNERNLPILGWISYYEIG
jgi:hypothetical protein